MTDKPNKRGGARPNSGPKPDISKRIICLTIALRCDVSINHVQHQISEGWKPEQLINRRFIDEARRIGASSDAHAVYRILSEKYAKRRAQLGYKQ